MAYAIRIKENSTSNTWLFERTFVNQDEFLAVKKLCQSKRRVGFFCSLVVPIRTNNLKNFCQDFFLPTFFNHALKKTDDVALLIFSAIGCLIWDCATFLIRVITVIPRFIANSYVPRESHPLYQYLVSNGADRRLLRSDHVYLRMEWEEGRIGLGEFESDKNRVNSERVFNFIDLPMFETSISASLTRRGTRPLFV